MSVEDPYDIPWAIPDKPLYTPRFSPWNDPVWQSSLRLEDSQSLVSSDRQFVLEKLLRQALATLPGHVAECGVFRGGTARMMADLMSGVAPRRSLYLFDTFEGMPETHPDYDLHKRGDFSNTSLEGVREFLSDYTNCLFRPGFIPDTFAGIEDRSFCFAHIDLDIYDAIADSSKFFYPRIPPGGFLVYDDYGFPSCPGARRAVDEFYADKQEEPLVLHTGQCLVFKTTKI